MASTSIDFANGLNGTLRSDGVEIRGPVTEAYALRKWLKSKKAQFEMKIYEDEGHAFERVAAWNACQQALAFLERHLQYKPAVASKNP